MRSAILAGLFFYAHGYENRYVIAKGATSIVVVGQHFFGRYVRERNCAWTTIRRDPKRRVALHVCHVLNDAR